MEWIKFGKNDGQHIFPLRVSPDLKASVIRTADVYEELIFLEDNSLVSHVYVKAIDPGMSVKVEYFDYSTGLKADEKYLAGEHDALTTVIGDRKVIGPVMNKIVARMTITGAGNCEVGVYAYSVSFSNISTEISEINGKFQITGLNNGGLHTEIPINETTWLPVPSLALGDRNAIGIQNQSSKEIKLNFNNGVAGWVGWLLKPGTSKFYDIKDTIIVYAKAKPGSGSGNILLVEEIS